MKTFPTLLRREWLEGRFTYLAATFGLVFIVCLFGILATLVATLSEGGAVVVIERMDDAGNSQRHEQISDNVAMMADFTSWTNRELEGRLTTMRMTVSSVFHAVYFLVIVFVLLGSVFDQRRDRSVLFWKSMPVSDPATILSKLIVPVWLVSILVVAAITLTWLFLLTLFSAITIASDLGSVTRLWAHSGILNGIASELVGYTIQGLWSLPIFAWLILVSTTVSRLPLVWTVLIPLIPAIGERIVFGSNVISGFVTRHLEFAALPRLLENAERQTSTVRNLGDQLSLLLSTELWLGVFVGSVLLAVAIYCYRRNNEL